MKEYFKAFELYLVISVWSLNKSTEDTVLVPIVVVTALMGYEDAGKLTFVYFLV